MILVLGCGIDDGGDTRHQLFVELLWEPKILKYGGFFFEGERLICFDNDGFMK